MQISHVIQGVAAVMDFAFHIKALRQMAESDQRCNAAGHRHVSAQNVGGILGDPAGHAIISSRRILGRHNRYIQFVVQFDVVINIFFNKRVFVPVIIQLFDSASDA